MEAPVATEAPTTSEVPTIPVQIPDASVYEAKNVASVAVRVESTLWPHAPTAAAPVVGTPFRAAEVKAQLAKFLGGGGFARGTVELSVESGGIGVVFRLVPSRLVRRVTIRGNVFGDDEVRRTASLSDVRDVTEASLQKASERIHAYYVRRGYPDARVEIATIETDNPTMIVVEVRITPSSPRTVGRREYVGVPTWDEAALAAAQRYGVKTGDRADDEAFELADRTLANVLRSDGYSSATVTHALKPLLSDPLHVVVVIQVVAGSKIVPTFEGNVVFDREQLLEILDLPGEADRSPVRLAGKIETAYVRRGYLDARVVAELLGKVEDRQRTLLFRVSEGYVVTITSRQYPCLRGALDPKRLNNEIDSFLDEELESGLGEVPPGIVDTAILGDGEKPRGARPFPDVPDAPRIFIPDVYDRATEHLRELYRSEGYIFVEIATPTLLRPRCAKGTMPGPSACRPMPTPPLPDVCRTDLQGLPQEMAPFPKDISCTADPSRAIACAPTATVLLPINPGPRSFLWDIAFDGTRALTPEALGKQIIKQELRLGDPLSLNDVEAARRHLIEHYRDEGYAFVAIRTTIEYSSDKTRARVRFVVAEGEQVIIDRILVEGHDLTLESLIRARLLIEEGGIYKANRVRTSQERLAELGVFSSASIGMLNPTIPAKRKTVIVTVVERLPQHVEISTGYSTGEGVRFTGEYGYDNLFGYAVSLTGRTKFSYQPFFGPRDLYDPVVIDRWQTRLSGIDRYPRRISVILALPHTPLFGGPVRTTLEAVNALDLRRDFKLERTSPILTFTYRPISWFNAVFGASYERNDFLLFEEQSLENFLSNNAQFATQLRVPTGKTAVGATRATFTFDFRDNRLGATKGGYFSITNEYVRTVDRAEGVPTKGDNGRLDVIPSPRQDFLHVTAGTGAYFRIDALPKKPVLALEVKGGVNFDIFSCAGSPTTLTTGGREVEACNTYPDRLFYLGGSDSFRGLYIGQMIPQDSIDSLRDLPPGTDPAIRFRAPRGGNVYVNPRVELRVPAFKWGGFVVFLDAANTWRDRTVFRPWILRYAAGAGFSFDTPVGPIALDAGFPLTRYTEFGEAAFAINFAVGRF